MVPGDRISVASGYFNHLRRWSAPEAHKLPTRGFFDRTRLINKNNNISMLFSKLIVEYI
jgi:hypothetical protein